VRPTQPPPLLVLHLTTAVSCLLTTWQVSVSNLCLHLYTSDPFLALWCGPAFRHCSTRAGRGLDCLRNQKLARSPPTRTSLSSPPKERGRVSRPSPAREEGIAEQPSLSPLRHWTGAEMRPVEHFGAAERAQGNGVHLCKGLSSHSLKWAPPICFPPMKVLG